MAPGLSVQMLAQTLPIVGFGLAASWLDWRYRRIPNWLCGALAIWGLTTAGIFGGSDALVQHALHFAAALAVGMVLFRLGVFGGGDAKYYAAVSTWFPVTMWARLAVYVSLAGLCLLTVWFVTRRLMGKKLRPSNPTKYDELPYGIAIALGAFAALYW